MKGSLGLHTPQKKGAPSFRQDEAQETRNRKATAPQK